MMSDEYIGKNESTSRQRESTSSQDKQAMPKKKEETTSNSQHREPTPVKVGLYYY